MYQNISYLSAYFVSNLVVLIHQYLWNTVLLPLLYFGDLHFVFTPDELERIQRRHLRSRVPLAVVELVEALQSHLKIELLTLQLRLC
jgi:hypothetical protein